MGREYRDKAKMFLRSDGTCQNPHPEMRGVICNQPAGHHGPHTATVRGPDGIKTSSWLQAQDRENIGHYLPDDTADY